MQIVWMARIFGFFLFVFLVGGVHYWLFHLEEAYWETIFSHLYMYIIYILISLLAAEHFLNFLKRKSESKKHRQTEGETVKHSEKK